MSSIKDLIAKKKQVIESNKAANIKMSKPLQGKNTYRILPAWRPQTEAEIEGGAPAPFWHDFSQHWIKLAKGAKPSAVYVCTEKTFGQPCDLCSALDQGFVNAKTDEQKDLLKENKSKQSYLLNVLHRDGKTPNQPILFEVGVTIFEQICDLIEEYDDITDLNEGVDLVITRSGAGFDTSYTVIPARNSKPVDESVMKNVFNLDAVVAQENATKQRAALAALGKLTGVAAPHTPALPKTPTNNAFEGDDEIDDAEYAEYDEETQALDDELAAAMGDSSVSSEADDNDDLDDLDLDDLLAAS